MPGILKLLRCCVGTMHAGQSGHKKRGKKKRLVCGAPVSANSPEKTGDVGSSSKTHENERSLHIHALETQRNLESLITHALEAHVIVV